MWSGPSEPRQVNICFVHHKYATRVSAFNYENHDRMLHVSNKNKWIQIIDFRYGHTHPNPIGTIHCAPDAQNKKWLTEKMTQHNQTKHYEHVTL